MTRDMEIAMIWGHIIPWERDIKKDDDKRRIIESNDTHKGNLQVLYGSETAEL